MNTFVSLRLAVGLWMSLLASRAAMAADGPAPVEKDLLDTQPGIVRVYENSFAQRPGAEWSPRTVGQTPAGNHFFLGDFVEEPVQLKLEKLPPHRLLRVSFDLYLMRAWDGSSAYWGEKIWDMSVVGGQRLIHTTFSNTGFFRDNNVQAFPETFPCRAYPAWTGAAEKQTLGVIQSWGGPERTFDTSSWYRMSLAFPHSDGSVALRFKATLRKTQDKSWALGNVRVEAVPDLLKLSEQQMAERFVRLGANDPTDAFKALWELVAAGDETVSFLADRWEQSAEPTDQQLRTWAKECTGDDKSAADRASWSLMTTGWPAYPYLSDALQAAGTSESAKARCQHTRFWIDIYPETSTELRQHRIHHLLEAIGTPAALALAAKVPFHAESDKAQAEPSQPAEALPALKGHIELDVRDASAESVFDELGSQSGVMFVLSDAGIWDDAHPVTLQTHAGWFWPTLLEVCRQSGTGFQQVQTQSGTSVRLTGAAAGDGSLTRFPSAQNNGFVLFATGASRSYSVDYARQNSRSANQMISLMLLAEPGASQTQVSPLRVAQADSKGVAVWGGDRSTGMPFSAMGPGGYLAAVMSPTPNDGPRTLDHLKLECSASFVAGVDRVEIASPLSGDAVRKSFTTCDLLLQPMVRRVQAGRTEYTTRLVLRLREPGRQMLGGPATLANAVTLTDAKGRRYSQISTEHSGANLVREQTLRFVNPDPAAIGEPAMLRIELPAATRTLPLTFELKNLVLP